MGAAVIIIALILLYFLPTIIAAWRGHRQYGPIAVVNIFLGWTMIGWVIALAMSVSHQTRIAA